MSRCRRPLTEYEHVEKAGVFGTVTEFYVEVVVLEFGVERDKVCVMATCKWAAAV